jgi:1-acyl-sn-glycerol-3-phosphate acyltransferase
MNWLRGYYRLCLAGLVLGLNGSLVILTALLPIRRQGIHLSGWLLNRAVRLLLFIFNVKVHCPEPDKLRRHHGFLFPNHVSYLDILVLVAITPVRFLAKAEVRSMPIIGTIAQAIGCVFVRREDKQSRAEARLALATAERFPPIVLFPEGKRGPGGELLPFRYGAFEILIQGNALVLPCVIHYDRLKIAIWHRGENFLKALWRLASHAGPIHARIILLEPFQPSAGDDPVHLSLQTHALMSTALEKHQAEPTTMNENPPPTTS